MKDYNDKMGTVEMSSSGEGHFEVAPSKQYAPSEIMSFKSSNYVQQIEGFKRQIEEIKYRQSKILRASGLGQASIFFTPGKQSISMSGVGIPVSQIYNMEDDDDIEMNQEQEEEELHRRLNGSIIDPQDIDADRFEDLRQRDTMKRWKQNNAAMMQRNASFKNPRNPMGNPKSLVGLLRRSQAPIVK